MAANPRSPGKNSRRAIAVAVGVVVMAGGLGVALMARRDAARAENERAAMQARRPVQVTHGNTESRAAMLERFARGDRCREAIRQKMPYLDAADFNPTETPDPAGGWSIRQRARLADSFQARAVGVVECQLDAAGVVVAVFKIPS